MSKTGTITFQPTYTANGTNNNRVYSLPGDGTPPPNRYDANGNLTTDTVHSYAWDSDGNTVTMDSIGLTFDALDRMVEQNRSGSYTQIVYGPGGGKLALMNGQTLAKGFAPLSGGDTAVYTSGPTLSYYRHADWLGSSRLASTPSRGLYYDGAYAPYGENYAEMGATDRNFTGQNQDTISSAPYPLYDFLSREQHPVWGRWLSPDPSGRASVNPGNPQSWNRYAYVTNNPLTLRDPLGMGPCVPGAPGYEDDCPQASSSGEGGGGSGDTFGGWWGGYSIRIAPLVDQTGAGSWAANGPAVLPIQPLNRELIAALVPGGCSAENLNDPSTFWDSGFATPDQVDAFFAAQPNAPSSWNGIQVGYAWGSLVNPGLAVGIMGAETSFGNGRPLSQGNINNPFSSRGATNFTDSMGGGLGTVAKIEATTWTPDTPLTALINYQNPLRTTGQAYETDPPPVQIQWMKNVNSWFRKFARFIGACQ